MSCIYRIETGAGETGVGFPFKFLATEKCADCQVLQSKGKSDATCQNPELTEKTCAISPQPELSS